MSFFKNASVKILMDSLLSCKESAIYIYLVLLQRAGSTNLAYETNIVDVIGTKELLLDSLRTSSPGRFGGGAGKGRRACNYVSRI